jgi:hypothetical protein
MSSDTPDSRVVGYSSLFRAAPDKGVYERGNGAVAMDLWNVGVMSMIFQYAREVLPGMSDIKVFFGEPVCNHISQEETRGTLWSDGGDVGFKTIRRSVINVLSA